MMTTIQIIALTCDVPPADALRSVQEAGVTVFHHEHETFTTPEALRDYLDIDGRRGRYERDVTADLEFDLTGDVARKIAKTWDVPVVELAMVVRVLEPVRNPVGEAAA